MSITHYQDTETSFNTKPTLETVPARTGSMERAVPKYGEVNVNSMFFSGRNNFRSFPREITYDNQQITFVESGMRYLLQKGQKMVQLFDMSDGHNNYRLQFDTQEYSWTLLKISALPR